jgi:two-component system sensor histidine kinase/response regulator
VTPPSAVLDIEHLAAIFGEIDDDVRDMMRLFIDSTAPILADLDARVAARDAVGAENAAHSAKGAARSAGAAAMASACEAVEIAARAGDWTAVEQQLPAIGPAFAATKAAIEAL